MNDPLLAEISMFAGTFAPRGWAFCNGQLLAISQNSALFSLIGTIYGGDGRTTFGLPDLRGRVPINSGGNSTGPGLSSYRLGLRGGVENVTLNILQIPSHYHQASLTGVGSTSVPIVAQGTINASTSNDGSNDPTDKYLGAPPGGTIQAADIYDASTDTTMASDAVTVSGTANLDLSSIPSTLWNLNVYPAGGSQSHTNIQPYLAINFCIALVGIYPSRN